MLTSIELTGFRGFHQLKLEGLKRVNLIVGKNNSGKTSLLEGVCGAVYSLRSADTLRFKDKSRVWIDSVQGESAESTGNWTSNGETQRVGVRVAGGHLPFCSVSVIAVFHGAPQTLVAKLGHALLDSQTEGLLESLLQDIDPRIKRVRIDPTVEGNQIVFDVGLKRLMPLSQMGQGIYRFIEIFAELIGENPAICLIDEIENGIHHSSLIDLWRGIASLSAQFGVQIFATTHSHECIEAAHEAFSDRPTYDFSVIQLFRKSNAEQGRVLHQEHIAAAMAGEIDLRG